MTHLIDFDRVVALYDGGERDFRDVQCQGNLISGNLPGIDLSNATLDGLSLDESDFTGANLSRSKITDCSLNATNFTSANLSGVEFSKKYRLNGSPFQLAILQGADSIERKEETYLSSLSCLQSAIFERANLSQSNLTKVNLIDANLRFANLEGASLTKADLCGADLTGANLVNVSFDGATLCQSNLTGANLEGANLTKADLRGADLTGANLVNVSFDGANLCKANLTGAILTETTLSKALVGWTIMPDGSISDSQAMDLIASKFKRLKRKAWKPITAKGDSELAVSKFAGKPWINPGDSYPMCEYCQTPLRFFLQLNLSQLPESLDRQFGDGLLQLFYCTNSESGCDGCDAFLIKNVQPTKTPLQYEMPDIIFDSMSALVEGEFPAKQIVNWQAMDDYPNSYDNQDLIKFLDEFGFDEAEFRTIVNTPNFKFDEDEFELSAKHDVDLKTKMRKVSIAIDFMGLTRMRPLEGDKLSGHPHWHQNEEFPNCPDCDLLMDRLIFEFASGDNIPYLWGDCGTAYILQCPECKDRVTFLHQE